MSSYPIAIRYVRALRGASQAHLLQADDGHYYATKSPENPQTRRVLVNEYLGAKIFERLGVATAQMIPLIVSQPFLDANPNFQLVLHKELIPLHGGVFLGSQYAMNPEKTAIYDFLPTPILPRVTNLNHYLGALIADQWLCNDDARQFVFFVDPSVPHRSGRGWRALAIDHGRCLGGHTWRLFDSPLIGVSSQLAVYKTLDVSETKTWLERLSNIEEHHLIAWIDEMPPEWLAGDALELRNLIKKLLRRKGRVPELVETGIETVLTKSGGGAFRQPSVSKKFPPSARRPSIPA